MKIRRRHRRGLAQLGVLFVGVLLWFFVLAPVFQWTRKEITVYPVRRSPEGRMAAAETIRYRVWPSANSVHMVYPRREELRGCTIVDRKNWRCPTAQRELIMENGKINVLPVDANGNPSVEQVSRLTWYRLSIFRRWIENERSGPND